MPGALLHAVCIGFATFARHLPGTAGATEVAGIVIPSISPIFLSVVAGHVLFALAAVLLGAGAMLSRKRRGRHSALGTFYYWSLAAAFGLSLILAGMRWSEDHALVILGASALLAATLGRAARRGLWRNWIPFHISGMSASYVLMLTAFYVDNGKNLPLWRDLPPIAFWLLPTLVGLPITLWVIRRRVARPPGLG